MSKLRDSTPLASKHVITIPFLGTQFPPPKVNDRARSFVAGLRPRSITGLYDFPPPYLGCTLPFFPYSLSLLDRQPVEEMSNRFSPPFCDVSLLFVLLAHLPFGEFSCRGAYASFPRSITSRTPFPLPHPPRQREVSAPV